MSGAEETTLYRAYNSDGVLLYVGIARNWGRRWGQHSERSSFFVATTRLELEQFPTREAALEAERVAIQTEHPIHNVKHNSAPEPLRRKRPPATIYPTWGGLVKLEPRLGLIAEDAAAVTPTSERFCANRVWYGRGNLRSRLYDIVGWGRHRDLIPEPVGGTLLPNGWRMYTGSQLKELHDPLNAYQEAARANGDPAILYTSEAYDAAYFHLYGLLPDCRECDCA